MAQFEKHEADKYAQLRDNMEIHIEDNLYDETKLKQLEDYVNKQVSEEALYDFHSNLYLMKMYSLYPEVAKKNIVIKLLLKAMMNLPESDFTSLVYLIPMTMQSKSKSMDQSISKQKEIEIILNLGQHLEDCEFDLFWKEYNLNKKIFEQFKSFEFEIRRYICLMIQSIYQNINISFLCQLLQLNTEKELENIINEINIGWIIDKKIRNYSNTKNK
mmetsp:Transcript_50666/g.45445  ORF Transcript_50666/g.45445 Transcript_50666/m.45445 type:complete len:216 (+) Transcript_50666:47-694(+)